MSTRFVELLDAIFKDCLRHTPKFLNENDLYDFLVEELSKMIRSKVLTGEIPLFEAFQLINYAGETLDNLLQDKNSAF